MLCGPNWFVSVHCFLISLWAICFAYIYIYQGPLKFWRRQAQRQQQMQSCSFPKDGLCILSMLKVIFITQTRPKINTSSGLFGPCLQGAVSVQIFNHIHFYKPVRLINSLRTRPNTQFCRGYWWLCQDSIWMWGVYMEVANTSKLISNLINLVRISYLKSGITSVHFHFSFLRSKVCMLHHGRMSNLLNYN